MDQERHCEVSARTEKTIRLFEQIASSANTYCLAELIYRPPRNAGNLKIKLILQAFQSVPANLKAGTIPEF